MENNSLLHQCYMCLSLPMLIHISIQQIFTEIMCFLFCILGSSNYATEEVFFHPNVWKSL